MFYTNQKYQQVFVCHVPCHYFIIIFDMILLKYHVNTMVYEYLFISVVAYKLWYGS